MKKVIITAAASLALTISISTALTFKLNSVQSTPVATNSSISESKVLEKSIDTVLEENTASQTDAKGTNNHENKTTEATKVDTKPKQALSRGGNTTSQSNTYNNNSTVSSSTSKFGELLSWSKANAVMPIGSIIKVTDLNSGKTFSIKRTFGTNHIDGEALTISDTNIIKNIWGGFSWTRRPVIVSFNGRKIAASMTAMPHAGVDSAPAISTVSNRSGDYGTGENLDAIKKNGMDGVIDIHFLNSTRHKDNKPDPEHQAAILKAAGK